MRYKCLDTTRQLTLGIPFLAQVSLRSLPEQVSSGSLYA